MTAARLGARSALAVTLVGVAYAVVLVVGMSHAGLSAPIVDPVLAAMELFTIASALPLLALFVALQATVPAGARHWGTLALVMAAMFTLATTGVHVYELTAGRQLGTRGLVWPSASYAVELLAWDLLLGIALLCGAGALGAAPGARVARGWLVVTGALCLAGLVGPAAGRMRWQLVGVVGYAVLLPVASWHLHRWFRMVEAGATRVAP